MSHSSDRASQNSTKQNLPTSRIFTPEEVEWQAVVVDDNTQQYYRDHPPEESAPDITTLLGVDDIPAELCARSQWVVWRYVEVDGRPTKKPFRVAKPLVGADSTNPREWGSFDAACALFNSNERLAQARRGAAGLGYVFAPDDPYAGVDLDKVIEDGELHPGASRIVEELDSYTEVSPSGTGLHVIVRGALQEGARNRTSSTPWGGEIEVYDRARFFCFTGKLWPTAPPTISGRHGELDALHTRFFPVKAKAERATYTPPTVSASRSDHEIITLASAAKNGAEFTALWPGPHVEGRASENDLSLCNHLAFWCGPDPDRIDGLFRQSGLMRDKWDEGRGATTYGRLTIDKALEGRTEFYEARPEVSADWRMGGESKGDAPGEEPNEEAAGEGGGPAAGAAAVTP